MKWDDGFQDRRLSLDITPLIDVVFLLVLFFAVSTSFISADDLSALREDVTNLVLDKRSLSAEVETRVREVAELRGNLLAQLETTRNLDAMVATLEQRRVTLRTSLDQVEREKRSLREQLEQAARDYASLNIALEGLGAERDRAAEQERMLRALLRDRETANTDLQSALADALASLTLEHDTRLRTRAELDTAAAELEETRSARSQLQSELAAAIAALDELRGSRDSLRQELAGTTTELEAARGARSRLESERATVVATLEEAHDTRALLEQALAKAMAALDRTHDASAQLEQRERLLQALLAEKAAEYEELEVRLVRANEGNEALGARLAGLEADTRSQGQNTLQMRTEILRLQAELARYRAVAELDREQIERILEAQRKLRDGLESYLRDNRIKISRDRQRLVLQLSDQVLFPSGSAEINAQGIAVLRTFGDIIKSRTSNLEIQIGGHTDNVPVAAGAGVLATNWGLSAARAVNVVRFLEEQAGIDARRLSAVGYGEQRPVAGNATQAGRAANRRIEIVLVPR